MISAQSMHNVELAFQTAMRANLIRDSGDICDITSIEVGQTSKHSGCKPLLITISSFVFRLIVIFRIFDNPATRAYYLRVDGSQTLDDVFAEVANMCGGALNRSLAVNFRHLAMSTPCPLDSQCMAYLDDLRPQRVASYGISINDSVKLQATLCLCCSAPVEVADSAAIAEVGGELEMF